MSEKKRLKKGEAKIQFFACREQINDLREAGYGIKAIYDKLMQDNLISMSYKSLHNNIMKDDRADGKFIKKTNGLKPVSSKLKNNNWSLDEKIAGLNKNVSHGNKKKTSEIGEEVFSKSELI